MRRIVKLLHLFFGVAAHRRFESEDMDMTEKEFDTLITGIVDEIYKKRDEEMAFEFMRIILDLLKQNGVIVKLSKTDKKIELEPCGCFGRYVETVSVSDLDFSEHDQQFKNIVKEIEAQNLEQRTVIKQLNNEIEDLKKFIDEKLGGWTRGKHYGISFVELMEILDKAEKYNKIIESIKNGDGIGDTNILKRYGIEL